MKTTDTPRTDALMIGGCIAINILEHARELERELNSITPTPVWPEIVRLQGKVASLDMQLTASLRNQLRSEETILRLRESLAAISTISTDIESEAWKLRSQLNRAVEIAEKIWADCSNGSEHTEIAALKGEIK